MKHFYFLVLLLFFFPSTSCMETVLFDVIPIISYNLTLADVNCLLRTSKAYNQKYSTGIPKNAADKIAQNYDKVTQVELKTIQFEINRFFQHNPLFCKKLQPHEYINTLVHYAQTDNINVTHYSQALLFIIGVFAGSAL